MRLLLVELDTVWEDPAANRERIAGAISGSRGVAVLPELCFSGFTMRPVVDTEAEPFLRRLARERGAPVIGGYVGEGPRNLAVAVGPDGAVLARYAKRHLFSYAGEDRVYLPGDSLPVFELEGARAAMLVCYDLRFPEAFRDAALRGAELFFVIANWPQRRVEHWRVLLRARAIENQAFVVGVNRVGEDPNERYESSSMVVAPSGEVLHEGPGAVEIDVAQARRLRREFPLLDDARKKAR